ncbi:MAG: hypothetical protein IPP18_10730 [Rhodocyclaceae bacterium]|jgi:hypothetical protein|nr:hypothetical protein [Rhodocyclaceae bacterium]MBK6676698.1 hypothetical protein [Rhodocyclaceae bacterium]MBK9309322.1 hypothetical protein [Rhodocyclaceae bacterium]MBK9955583.1 hypothetical protein [Rhodocyclaceae bacterium]
MSGTDTHDTLRLLEADGAATGQVWQATLIQAGLSANQVYYADAVLREAVSRFDGARIYVKSDADHLKGASKDVRQLVGWVSQPRFVEGAAADGGRIEAAIHLPGLPDDIRKLLIEAHKAGRANLIGLSIDATGSAGARLVEGRRVRAAQSITRVDSVDLIVEPGAGGRLVRLIEAAPAPLTPPEVSMREKLLLQLKDQAPAAYARIDVATATDDEVMAAYREAFAPPATGAGEDVLEQVRMIEARMQARSMIAASTLPDAAKTRLQDDFAKRARFAEADVMAAIESERTYLARFAESGRVDLAGLVPDIQVEDRAVKMADMLDAFFDPAHKDHRSVGSFREAYIEFTGDRHVTGQYAQCDQARLRESAGASFREALDSTSWADALGNSITRRMQQIYVGEPDLQAWRKVATVGRVNDFRSQERFRVGGYGNLPAVAEGGAYAALTSPGDDKATYAATKRGGLETVTREMILNDDVNAIRRIPAELALAAGNTLYEFVFDFFRTNPTVWDAVALYHASHANLFTAALDATQFAAHRLAMVKQARAGSAKRMGVSPATVLIPFELQETAYNLFVRNQNLDKTFVQTINPEVIVVSYWTDANDWVTVADPMKLPVLEISFMNGQETPELFVQDMPNVGSMFSNDKLTYKIRHEYGGAVLVDGEKGTTKAVVP